MFSRIVQLNYRHLNRGPVQKALFLKIHQPGIRPPSFCDGIMTGTRNFSSGRLKNWSSDIKNNIKELCKLFSAYCHVVMAQRIQRLQQALTFYRYLYGERMVSKFIDNFAGLVLQNCRNKPFCVLLSACLFSWQKDNITNEDFERCIDDMESVSEIVSHANANGYSTLPGGWESIINKPHLKVWRKPIVENSHLYEYRVYGSFDDIPARAFYNIQIDLEFWQSWEKMALDINIIDKHKETGSEIVHWLTKFPYPMYSREYLYVRRYKEYNDRNVMVVSGKAIEHPDIPITDQYVRVKEYVSQFVIKPHTNFDDNGFDYILTYFDDPQSAFPSFCYNWLASSGVPEFVNNLHKAAKAMDEKMKKGYRPKCVANSPDKKNLNNDNTPVSNYA
ncbi:stAR-related lipid transfer protein 7, mitochondrial [Patella vulgata]|uniref:stAR-related lipid transfer protein 7, mitochondrial n=1 Tax=Patella vulgata TaxID=6465 RepID=UPI00217F7C32|nr:stAR-related lipid transfer protein 7, mitochondrial [Patella vulgata]